MKRLAAVLVASFVAAVVPLSESSAGDPIVTTTRAVRWSGGPVSGVAPAPEACTAATCSERRVKVQAPAWTEPGGVQFGIRWVSEEEDLDLYVYGPSGELVAQSVGIVSTAESTTVRKAKSGTYRVVVVPSDAERVRYEGIAQVQFDRPSKPVRELRPDLVSRPVTDAHIKTSAYLFHLPVPSMPNGCYAEEMAEQGARRCLRFNQTIGNVGDGPFELRYRMDGVATTQALKQRIFRSDGTFKDRFADTYIFHATHAHFHYANFAQSHLWRADAKGRRLDAKPLRTGKKNGFCMIDVENIGFGRTDDASRTYFPPVSCMTPTSVDDNSGEASMVSGISSGWADIYTWYLADQFIEISGVPDGYYLIQTVADPGSTVVEEKESNNTNWSLVRLCGDNVEVVGKTKAC